MIIMNKDLQIILGSGSPRRKELLQKVLQSLSIESPFKIMAADIDESVKPHEDSHDYTKRLAHEKAKAILEKLKSNSNSLLLITADTTVVCGQKILGKPEDDKDAFDMLQFLNGKTHEVITGYCILERNQNHDIKMIVDAVVTKVKFKVLTQKQIIGYIATKEPFDKAGSYGIQGKASEFIESLEGSFDNVVGLPSEKITEILQNETSILSKPC